MRHVMHQHPELVVRVGIEGRVPIQLAARLVMIGPGGEIVPIEHRRDRALERQDLQPVTGKIEVANDLRPQQTHHVRELGELESGNDLLGHRRAAHDVPPLEDEHLFAGAREVRGADEPVVTGTDDDGVDLPVLHDRFLAGS